MAGSYTQAELNTEVTAIVSGSFTTENFLTVANRAVRDVLSEVDLRSSIRKSSLSPNLFDDVYEYSAPSDLKGDKIIDIKPQVNRGRYDIWDLITAEEFDRKKQDIRVDRYGDPIKMKGTQWLGENLVSIARDDLVNKLLLSRPIDDEELGIDTLDAIDDWTGFGDGENITKDADNYVKGSACLNWDINADGGITAGIVNSALDTFDISDYKTNGSVFAWVYLSDATDVTNFIVRIGSSSLAYYSVTITTNNEGVAFYDGWNLLRFDLGNKATTGSPDDDGCNYVALYMTKDAGKTSETDYRFDNITIRLGDHYNTIYYSRHFWQSSAGVYLEDATTETDVLNCETDEYNLIIGKTCQYMEEHLKNLGEANRHETIYERKKAKYIQENPSRALLLIQGYYEL